MEHYSAYGLTALHVAISYQNFWIPAFDLDGNVPYSANVSASDQDSHRTDVIGNELKREYKPQDVSHEVFVSEYWQQV